MAALFDFFRKDEQYEPSPRFFHYATSVEGSVYVYSGRTQRHSKEKDSLQSQVEVYHSMTEGWTQKKTQGDLPPPGLYDGACTSTRDGMCTFGGVDGKVRYGDLYHLALSTMTWRRVCSMSRKSGCRMVTFNNNKVALLGGYGPTPSDLQPGATFTSDNRYTDGRGWNNEFHTFDLDTGVLSFPPVTGSRPPPCSFFSFTSVDDHRAVMFGGAQPGGKRVNDLYVIDFDTMHWTKIEQGVGEPWPVARYGHSACCLGYGGDHPHLLVSGGLDKDNKTLGDIWLFDLSSRKWKKITLPDDTLQTKRFYHSTTAIPLTAGLIEVVMFGGCPQLPASYKSDDDLPKISETTILRFEFKDTPSADGGLSTMEWVLADVATNKQRGATERIQEKTLKMATKAMEFAGKGESVPSPDHTPTEVTELRETIRVLREEKRVLEERVGEGERRAELAEARAVEAEERGNTLVREANGRLQEAEATIQGLLQSVDDAQKRATEAEDRANTQVREATQRAEAELREVEEGFQETTRLLEQANQRAQEAETAQREFERRAVQEATRVQEKEHWIVQREEVAFTDRELGRGGWGEVKVARFRGTNVAAKQLFQQISQFYRLLFIREMSMAARIRHPCLVQFIGATLDQEPIILTELMSTSLRAVLERGPISHPQITSISQDVARALNYLHLMQPDPLIHRDISSANVLLDPLPNGRWKAKISDYGSVNLLQQLQTVGPGSPVYAAPEASTPAHQSPKMDIFSFGILLLEMLTDTFPEVNSRERLILSITHPRFVALIRRCLDPEKDNRPSADEIITELSEM